MLLIGGNPVLANVDDIIDLLRHELHEKGIELLSEAKLTGDNIMLTCPKHAGGKENNPSCGVSLYSKVIRGREYEAGTVHCFTCGYVSDLPSFISFCFGKKDKGIYGLQWLLKRYGSINIEERKINVNISREKGQTVSNYISEAELEKYRYYHPYMYQRKITDGIIEMFDVGYDEDNNCITFPVRDLNGRTVFIQRRSISSKKYINPESVDVGDYIYGLFEVVRFKSEINSIWITESIIDCLNLWSNGIYAVALMRAIPTAKQLQILNELFCRTYILSLDNDDAGREGSKILREILQRKLLYKAEFPKGAKDINDIEDISKIKKFLVS